MTLRRRDNPVISPSTSPEIWPRDDILAPNSDTESEPLVKRRKHIDQIAQFYRDGGELVLISTTLRGPVIQNPWRRPPPPPPPPPPPEKERRKRKRNPKVASAASAAKDRKVDRYFVAQKNSQERDAVVAGKKKMSEMETHIVEKENTIVAEKSSQQKVAGETTAAEKEFKAVPRVIDFNMVPQSTDIPSQNYPSLQIITPARQARPAQPISSELDDSNTLRPENAITHSDQGVGLFDSPTPEKPTSPRITAAEPTARELESIRNLISQEPPQEPLSNHDPSSGLFDDPTPQPISTKSPPPPAPPEYTPPDSFPRILPSSLTKRPSNQSFSPVNKPFGPLELSRLEEMSSLQTSSTPTRRRSHHRSQSKRRRSSSVTLLPSVPPQRPSLQRSHSHQTTPSNGKTPLNTQSMYDHANQSFNAIVQPPTKQPITPLLPAATFTSRPPTPRNALLFTPFRVLNTSPVRGEDEEEEGGRLSFKLGDGESPLTYSPLVRADGPELWGDMRGFMGTWSLEEEVEKYKALGGKEGEGSDESQSKSQGVLVAA